MDELTPIFQLQTTQPTSGGAVTADSSCCANCVEPPCPHQWGPDLPFFLACRPCGPAGWLALLLTKAGDVETKPGPTTLNKKVWICDICHKQIHARKQISIRCNRIEHWVHLRCAGIRQSQYTRYLDLPSTQRIQTHTSHRHNTTPPLPTLVQAPYPLPTYTTATKTHVQHSPCPQRIGKAQTQFSHPLIPLYTHTAPSQTHTHVTHSTNTSHKHVTCTRQNT